MIKRRRHNKYSKPVQTPGRVRGKRSAPKHRILILEDDGLFESIYFVGMAAKGRSPRHWERLSDVTYSARLFRGLLANADLCEIVPPENHQYSGG